MAAEQRIEQYYQEAVKGLSEAILDDEILWYSYVLSLSDKEKTVYTTAILHQQVFNGGFHQYFLNSYGMFAYLTMEVLDEIGAYKIAKLLKRAIEIVNAEGFSEKEFRHKIFKKEFERIVEDDEDVFDALNNLDTEYYAEYEELIIILDKYLKE